MLLPRDGLPTSVQPTICLRQPTFAACNSIRWENQNFFFAKNVSLFVPLNKPDFVWPVLWDEEEERVDDSKLRQHVSYETQFAFFEGDEPSTQNGQVGAETFVGLIILVWSGGKVNFNANLGYKHKYHELKGGRFYWRL